MFVASNFVLLVLAILLSSHESEPARTVFASRPLDPSFAVEESDFTLEWTYTLDGTLLVSNFFNVSDTGPAEPIGKVIGSSVNATYEAKYQARFRLEATNTRAKLTILAVQRLDDSRYRINVVPTGSGTLTHDAAVIVQYQPSLTLSDVNRTVDEGDVVNFNYTYTGFPSPDITWTRLSTNRNLVMPLTIRGKQDEGFYRCTANNGIGKPATVDVFITVQSYRPINTNFSTNLTNGASLNKTFYLMCSAEANPAAEFRLYKENESVANITARNQSIGLYATSASDRVNQVVFRCIPFNSFGDGPTKTVVITVNYPVEATGDGINDTVIEGGEKNFSCPVDGNPEPNIEWYKGSEASGTPVSYKKVLSLKDVRGSGCYTCIANNSLGTSVSISHCLFVYGTRTTISSTILTVSQQSTSAPSTAKPTGREGTSAPSTAKPTGREGSPGPPWIIIIAVGGGVVVLAIVVGVLACWVHKQRKCRSRDTKSKDQTLLASRRSHGSRQRTCLCWPTYKRVISNV